MSGKATPEGGKLLLSQQTLWGIVFVNRRERWERSNPFDPSLLIYDKRLRREFYGGEPVWPSGKALGW